MKTIRFLTISFLSLAFSFIAIPSSVFCADEEKNEENVQTDENISADEILSAGARSDTFEQYRVLIDLIDSVSRNYVHTMSREELIQAAIEGVTSKLDPYSYYIAKEEQENFQREMNSHFGGVGMAIDNSGDKTKVLVPLVGMPAYNAGIHCGDEILEVDGISLEGKKIDEVLKLLSGEIGSTVTLKIRRVNEKNVLDFEITRELILQETVLGFDRNPGDDSWNYWLDAKNGIAYIHITEFRDETANEFRKVLTELQKPREGETESPLKGLILDLRFNPGGDFNVAIEMCDFFITDGIIVTAKGKNTVEENWRAKPETLIPKEIPMVLLLNSFSASASEVFSACLQDHHRAVIVGERSYGKGIIQSVMPFEGGASMLKLTTAGYYSPNGRNIHRNDGAGEGDEWGVQPDEENLVQTSRDEDEAFLMDRIRRGALKTHNDLKPTKNPSNYQDETLLRGLEVVESALKTGAKAKAILWDRSAPYRENSGNGATRRRGWGR